MDWQLLHWTSAAAALVLWAYSSYVAHFSSGYLKWLPRHRNVALLGAVSFAAAVVSALVPRFESSLAVFSSSHGKMGLASILALLPVLFLGIGASVLWSPHRPLGSRPVFPDRAHRYLSWLFVALTLATVYSGVATASSPETAVLVFIALPLFILFFYMTYAAPPPAAAVRAAYIDSRLQEVGVDLKASRKKAAAGRRAKRKATGVSAISLAPPSAYSGRSSSRSGYSGVTSSTTMSSSSSSSTATSSSSSWNSEWDDEFCPSFSPVKTVNAASRAAAFSTAPVDNSRRTKGSSSKGSRRRGADGENVKLALSCFGSKAEISVTVETSPVALDSEIRAKFPVIPEYVPILGLYRVGELIIPLSLFPSYIRPADSQFDWAIALGAEDVYQTSEASPSTRPSTMSTFAAFGSRRNDAYRGPSIALSAASATTKFKPNRVESAELIAAENDFIDLALHPVKSRTATELTPAAVVGANWNKIRESIRPVAMSVYGLAAVTVQEVIVTDV